MRRIGLGFMIAAMATLSVGMARAQMGGAALDPDQAGKYGATSNPHAAGDRVFCRDAEESGLGAVALGQMAQEKGSTADVQAFGKRMADEQTALDFELTSAGTALGTSTLKKLGKKDQQELDRLKGLSGAAFDHEFLSYVISSEAKTLREYHDESSMAGAPDLKDAVVKGEAILQARVETAKKLAGNGAG